MTVIIPEDGGAVRFRRGAEGVRTAGAGVEPWVQAVATDYGPVCRGVVWCEQVRAPGFGALRPCVEQQLHA